MEEAEGLGDKFVLTHHIEYPVEPRPAVMDMPPFDSIIAGGISGVVYKLNAFYVLKAASGFNHSHEDLDIERRIYERLRSSHRQILYFELEPRGLILERLACPLRQLLRHFRREGKVASDGLLMVWACQVVNGLWYIHSKGVLQADIGCHNLLLYISGDLKFCDFGGASIGGEEPTVDYEIRSRHPTIRGPSVATEIFALGTLLYEMSTTVPPHPEVDTADGTNGDLIQSLYTLGMFPDVDHLMLGDIIDGCWKGSYDSTLDIAFEMRITSASARSQDNEPSSTSE